MMKQRFQWMMAAIMTICGAIMVLTSCADNDDTPTSTSEVVEPADNPTEDAVSVTTNKSYVMYGDFDEEFGNALGRRLQGPMASPAMPTSLLLIPRLLTKLVPCPSKI